MGKGLGGGFRLEVGGGDGGYGVDGVNGVDGENGRRSADDNGRLGFEL